MDDEIVFRGVDSDLVLEVVINEYGWTRCHFAKGQERIFLGAETIGFIVTRLSQGINELSCYEEFDLEGEKVHCVLPLSERHHVLYVASGKLEKRLFWQDADNDKLNIAGIITIRSEQKEEWLRQLGSLKDKWSQTPQWKSR